MLWPTSPSAFKNLGSLCGGSVALAGYMQVYNCICVPDSGNQSRGKRAKTGMKIRHLWIEIVSLCIAIACGFALLIAVGAAAVGVAKPEPAQSADSSAVAPPARQQTYEGMITDAHCGAKHEASISKTASDCARACVHAGSQFALVDGDKTYILTGDLERLKRAAGLRVKVVGALNGDTIVVSSITPGS
jgi:hypothetical protein